MATYYVSVQTGRDSNDGLSPDTPWATLTKAANTVVAGDTVIVAPGIYREQVSPVNSGNPDAPIRFIADPWAEHFPDLLPDEVHITGVDSETQDPTTARDYGIRLYRLNYIEFEGFTISRCKQAGVYIEGYNGNYAKGLVLRYLHVHHCRKGIYRKIYQDAVDHTVVYDLPLRIKHCVIERVNTGVQEHHHRTYVGNGVVTGYRAGQILACRMIASQVGVLYQANGSPYSVYASYARVDGEVIGGSVEAATAFQYVQAYSWAEGITTISGVEVEAETVADWNNHPVTLNDLDVRYCNTLAVGAGGGTKVVAGARIQFASSLGSGFSVGQPIYGAIPDHERRSGAGIDPYSPISGQQSARVAVPQFALHEWGIPAVEYTPLHVTFKARKNFPGGTVRFYLGPAWVELADTTDTQVLQLSYRPKKTGIVPFRLVAEAPYYSGADAVWVDDIIVG